MKNYFLSAFFIIFFSVVFSQTKGYVNGYILTTSGDSITGEIKHKSGEEIKERVYVKLSEEEKKTVKIEDILYMVAGNESYISYKVNSEQLLLKELSIGALNLYEHQFLFNQGGKDVIKYSLFIKRNSDKELTEIKPGGWKKQLSEFLGENQSLVEDINKNKYSLEDLSTVITRYNNWKAENNE